jgi:hypothetical protein
MSTMPDLQMAVAVQEALRYLRRASPSRRTRVEVLSASRRPSTRVVVVQCVAERPPARPRAYEVWVANDTGQVTEARALGVQA